MFLYHRDLVIVNFVPMFSLISMLFNVIQQELTLSFILLKNYVENTTRFLKHVWPFFNIMKERVNGNIGAKWIKELNGIILFFQQIIITIYCLYLNNTILKRSFLRNKCHSEEITKSSILHAFENKV